MARRRQAGPHRAIGGDPAGDHQRGAEGVGLRGRVPAHVAALLEQGTVRVTASLAVLWFFQYAENGSYADIDINIA